MNTCLPHHLSRSAKIALSWLAVAVMAAAIFWMSANSGESINSGLGIISAIKGMLAPTYKEVVQGRAEVRQTIHVPNVGTIAGSYVTDGKVTRNSLIRIIRDGVIIAEDKISSLKRFKDDVREVAQSFECGIGLERFNDIKVGDVFEAYIMEEVAK